MIGPETLSVNQRRFLLQHYQLDVEQKRRSLKNYLASEMFLWICPFLAGLKDAFLFLYAWIQTKRRHWNTEPPPWIWYRLFADHIRPPSRSSLILWIGRAGFLAVLLVAIHTGRPVLAMVWALALVVEFAYDRWEHRVVRCALGGIEAKERQSVGVG